MAGITNRGKTRIAGGIFRGETLPTNFYLALCAATNTPTADTNTMADLAQVPVGNGYVDGGISLSRNSTDFDVLTEDDTNDWVVLQLKDISWTASGGDLPSSGLGARWGVLTNDNATVSLRDVWTYWDLVSNRIVSVGQTLTLQNCEIRIAES